MTCLENIPSVDHAFCGRLYVYDFKRGSLLSMEVVQTFNRTSLSDITSYRVLSSDKPLKNSRQNAKNIMYQRSQNAKRTLSAQTRY